MKRLQTLKEQADSSEFDTMFKRIRGNVPVSRVNDAFRPWRDLVSEFRKLTSLCREEVLAANETFEALREKVSFLESEVELSLHQRFSGDILSALQPLHKMPTCKASFKKSLAQVSLILLQAKDFQEALCWDLLFIVDQKERVNVKTARVKLCKDLAAGVSALAKDGGGEDMYAALNTFWGVLRSDFAHDAVALSLNRDWKETSQQLDEARSAIHCILKNCV